LNFFNGISFDSRLVSADPGRRRWRRGRRWRWRWFVDKPQQTCNLVNWTNIAFIDYDSDDDVPPLSSNMKTDSDPYAGALTLFWTISRAKCNIGIFFSKDRREEVIEVEEEPELVPIPGSSTPVKIMTQGQWMKGCPEGGEQSFLFSLYSRLNEGEFPCPQGCGASITRRKGDFFAIFVSFLDLTVIIIEVDLFICHGLSAWVFYVHRSLAKDCASRMPALSYTNLRSVWRTHLLWQSIPTVCGPRWPPSIPLLWFTGRYTRCWSVLDWTDVLRAWYRSYWGERKSS